MTATAPEPTKAPVPLAGNGTLEAPWLIPVTNDEVAEVLNRRLAGTGWWMFRYKMGTQSIRFMTNGTMVKCRDCGRDDLPPAGQKLAMHNAWHHRRGDKGVYKLEIVWP